MDILFKLKEKRNFVAHDDPNVENWNLQDIEKELLNDVKELMTLIAQIQSIPKDKVDEQFLSFQSHLKSVKIKVENKSEIIETMREELHKKHHKKLTHLFYKDPNDSHSGILNHYILPHFLNTKKEKFQYKDLFKELKDRKFGLLIESQAGLGKSSLAW